MEKTRVRRPIALGIHKAVVVVGEVFSDQIYTAGCTVDGGVARRTSLQIAGLALSTPL